MMRNRVREALCVALPLLKKKNNYRIRKQKEALGFINIQGVQKSFELHTNFESQLIETYFQQ